MIAELRELVAYDRWANRRVLDAVAGLDRGRLERELGSSHGSILGTLVHMLSAEWIWLQRWRGASPTAPPASWDTSTLDGVRRPWAEVEDGIEAFTGSLLEEEVDRPLVYLDLKGTPHEDTFGETIRHVVNHSTFHRGQVVGMLRQVGAVPPNTDLIAFYRGRR